MLDSFDFSVFRTEVESLYWWKNTNKGREDVQKYLSTQIWISGSDFKWPLKGYEDVWNDEKLIPHHKFLGHGHQKAKKPLKYNTYIFLCEK